MPLAPNWISPAQAQAVSVSIEFRSALEPYGRWTRHPRYGEVWIPVNRPRDWRPYTRGHWIYTEDWGWYWIADNDEARWGWVAYHYGRWVFDRDSGWVWIAGREWGPAWVNWRRGTQYVGWAPMAPDDIVVEMHDDPVFWTFVRPADVVAPRIFTVILPQTQRTIYFQETVVVNRTIIIEDRGPRFAVNPGIPPAYIAAAARRPLATFRVQPRVLAGTQGVTGAVVVRAEELRGRAPSMRPGQPSAQPRETVTEQKSAAIQPAASVPPPQSLQKNERGRLGERPPKAALGAKSPGDAAPTPMTSPSGTATTPTTPSGGTATAPKTLPGGTTTIPGTRPGGTTTTPATQPGGSATAPMRDQPQRPAGRTPPPSQRPGLEQRQQPSALPTPQQQPGTPPAASDRRQRPAALPAPQEKTAPPERRERGEQGTAPHSSQPQGRQEPRIEQRQERSAPAERMAPSGPPPAARQEPPQRPAAVSAPPAMQSPAAGRPAAPPEAKKPEPKNQPGPEEKK